MDNDSGAREQSHSTATPQKVWPRNVAVLIGVVALVLGAIWLGKWWRSSSEGISSVEAGDGAGSGVVVGDPAPTFTARDLDGNEVTSQSFDGKATWIIFNATWCTDCRIEAPDIQAIYEAHSVDLNIVAFYVNDREDTVRQWSQTLGLSYTQVVDANSEAAAAYGVAGIPHHVFIDPTGIVVDSWIGALSRSQMDEKIGALLAQQ
ncbi:TlpA family protein disulfide reductase [Schaalia suimastitidis]|uniref:TlpA family protein disulfide reductase n=1 Tax=Schaalia suimastitidis TaxID=121163 RepID=UPI0003FB38B6|nr:TlpA disulfide reductase family protein [Schaalia suimastitidis]